MNYQRFSSEGRVIRYPDISAGRQRCRRYFYVNGWDFSSELEGESGSRGFVLGFLFSVLARGKNCSQSERWDCVREGVFAE